MIRRPAVPARHVREFFIPDDPREFAGPPVGAELDLFRQGGFPLHIIENGKARRIGTVAAFDGRTFPPRPLDWNGPKIPLFIRREEFARRFGAELR